MRLFRVSATIVLTAATVTAVATAGATASAAATPAATIKYQTRVSSFTVPATREVHSLFKISGTAQEHVGSRWTAAGSVLVDYYFRMLPSGKWVHAGTGTTNSRGDFSSKLGLIKFGHTQWQARVRLLQRGSVEYLASSSRTRDSFFTDRTYVTSFVALHFAGETELGAIMQDWPPSGGVTYTTVRGVAKFYYHPKGTNKWRYLGSSRTDSSGAVSLELGAINGYFRIVFPAQGYFLGSVSKTEYLG